MKPILFVVLCFMSFCERSDCTKHDSLDDETLNDLLSDPNLAKYLDDPDQLLNLLKNRLDHESEEDPCPLVRERSSTIIRTKESQDAGAVFISTPSVRSRQECMNSCCADVSCNTAIFKEKKGEWGCYLFNCWEPSVCLFSPHEGFSVLQMNHRDSDGGADELPITTSRKLTSTTRVPTTQGEMFEPGYLYSTCRTSVDCFAVNNARCLSGYCVCQSGFRAIDSVCRKECNRYQFECVNKDSPELSQCISIYNRCDSFPHCLDQSDELNCDNTATNMSNVASSGALPTKSTTVSIIGKPSASTQAVTKKHSTIPDSPATEKVVAPPTTLARSESTVSRVGNLELANRNGDHDVTSRQPAVIPPVNAGVVVALALSLTIVVTLIFFAVCRFRHRRVRKVKLVNGNEADYLINGMYL